MFDIFDLESTFNKNKETIIKTLIDYYGEEYSEVIRERIENTVFIFQSDPEVEYKYIESHKDQVSKTEALLIKTKYYHQKAVEEEIRKKSIDYIFTAISVTFFGGRLDQKYKNQILDLFSDVNFNSSLIDSYSTKNIERLNNPKVIFAVRTSIKSDQEYFLLKLKELGLKPDINPVLVDKYIEIRKKCQTEYRNQIIEKTPYGKSISKAITQKYGVIIPPENLHDYIFLKSSFAHTITGRKNNEPFSIHIIKLPVIELMTIGTKGIDVELIHEIIHRIETNGTHVGITNHDKNIIANEIRTQKTSIKTTKKIHENGVFIFDNPKYYKIEGESLYEALFPITEELLEEYETLFKECSINNDLETISNSFGEEWDEYSKLLDIIYKDIELYFAAFHEQYRVKKTKEMTEKIDKMRSHEKRGSKHV